MDTVSPDTVDEVGSVLGQAAEDGLAVAARGAGTKPGWGAPPRACDLVVDLSRLDRVRDHAAGDMVVQVQAGVPLGRLAAVVGEAGQQLALDVPAYDDGTQLDAGTVGGALAVGTSGPRRLRYGRPRDLLLGVTMVRADGQVASSGGRVVKNVAGYDLGKLLCGSYGTLGVIVEATLRLHPLPAATAWLTATAPDAAGAYGCAAAVLDSQLAPSAVELDRPGPGQPVTVAALFEGTGDGVAARAAAAAELAGGSVAPGPPEWFGRWPGSPSGTLVEVSFPPAALAGVLDALDGLGLPARGSPGTGVLQLTLPGDGPAGDRPAGALLPTLRAGLAPHGGRAVVRHHPAPDRGDVSVPAHGDLSTLIWGPVDPGALALMRRVKDQFDPDHRLAPGRFVGGM